MIEAHVKKKLREWLKEIGAYQFWPVQTGRGAATIDCLICHKGQFYGVETKRPGVKAVTHRQDCIMREIAEAGGGVCMENDPLLPTVKAMIK